MHPAGTSSAICEASTKCRVQFCCALWWLTMALRPHPSPCLPAPAWRQGIFQSPFQITQGRLCVDTSGDLETWYAGRTWKLLAVALVPGAGIERLCLWLPGKPQFSGSATEGQPWASAACIPSSLRAWVFFFCLPLARSDKDPWDTHSLAGVSTHLATQRVRGIVTVSSCAIKMGGPWAWVWGRVEVGSLGRAYLRGLAAEGGRRDWELFAEGGREGVCLVLGRRRWGRQAGAEKQAQRGRASWDRPWATLSLCKDPLPHSVKTLTQGTWAFCRTEKI